MAVLGMEKSIAAVLWRLRSNAGELHAGQKRLEAPQASVPIRARNREGRAAAEGSWQRRSISRSMPPSHAPCIKASASTQSQVTNPHHVLSALSTPHSSPATSPLQRTILVTTRHPLTERTTHDEL